jgi:hypothetical protein
MAVNTQFFVTVRSAQNNAQLRRSRMVPAKATGKYNWFRKRFSVPIMMLVYRFRQATRLIRVLPVADVPPIFIHEDSAAPISLTIGHKQGTADYKGSGRRGAEYLNWHKAAGTGIVA